MVGKVANNQDQKSMSEASFMDLIVRSGKYYSHRAIVAKVAKIL